MEVWYRSIKLPANKNVIVPFACSRFASFDQWQHWTVDQPRQVNDGLDPRTTSSRLQYYYLCPRLALNLFATLDPTL